MKNKHQLLQEKIAKDIFYAMTAYGDARARGEMVFPPTKEDIKKVLESAFKEIESEADEAVMSQKQQPEDVLFCGLDPNL